MIAVVSGLVGAVVLLWTTGGPSGLRRASRLDRVLAAAGSAELSAGRTWARAVGIAGKRLFPQDMELTALSGLQGGWTPERLALLRLALGLGGGAVGLLSGLMAGVAPLWPAAGLSVAGGWLPSAWLAWRTRRRQATLRGEFPLVVDLLALCAGAGMNLHQAVELAGGMAEGEMAGELRRAAAEVHVGRRPIAALREVSLRTGLPEVEALVAALAQAETFGTPVSRILSDQASLARSLARQQVEARVGRLPVLLTVCSLVFLFPALFVLVLLPNVLAFIQGRW
jgi:tight adherence protein C